MRVIHAIRVEDTFRSHLGGFILDLRRLLLLCGFGGSMGGPFVQSHEEADHNHQPDHHDESEFSSPIAERTRSKINGDNP